jgi:hypothetical protein
MNTLPIRLLIPSATITTTTKPHKELKGNCNIPLFCAHIVTTDIHPVKERNLEMRNKTDSKDTTTSVSVHVLDGRM